MNLAQSAAAIALNATLAVAGVGITYTQGGVSSQPLTATVGKTEYEINDGATIVETWTSRDYLLPASSLVIANTVRKPAKGDTIQEVIAGQTHTFTVLAPDGKPIAEFMDRGQTWLRIHTKQTA